MERRGEAENSLTERCENCTTCEPPASTIAIRFEHDNKRASSCHVPPIANPVSTSGSLPRHRTLMIEVDCEDFHELLHMKRPDGNHQALQYALSEALIRLRDFLQYMLICNVQRFRQFPKLVGQLVEDIDVRFPNDEISSETRRFAQVQRM